MHGFTDPVGIICALWEVQGGKCFHCNKPMIFVRCAGIPKGMMATREHVYPRGLNGKALHHNVVLAHADCNNKRGCRPPTDEEITKAKAIYMLLGLTPFVPDAEWCVNGSLPQKQVNSQSSRWEEARKRWASPTMADIWPK